MGKKSRVIKTPGWWIIRAVIDPDAAERLSKDLRRLPIMGRRWCRKIGAWAIHRKHTDFVIELAKRHLGISVSG